MRLFTKYLLLTLVFCLFFSPITEAKNIKGVINLGADFGGDELVDVVFFGGDTEDINAGELLSISAGVIFDSEVSETHLTVGYKFDSVNAVNGDIDWKRYPLDLLYLYKLKKFRVGGGLTYHLSPELKGDGFAAGLQADYDDALGFLIQTNYNFTDNFSLGLRYTIIEYEGDGLIDKDGNSVGLMFGFSF